MTSNSLSERLTLSITDLSRGGAGVGRDAQGRVIFTPFTLPGDVVEVRVIEAEKNFAQAECLKIVSPSSDRVTPPCKVFGQCGGCQWQHIPYDLQWKTKSAGALHALKRVGVGTEGVAVTELPAQNPWHYRNRVQLRGEAEQLGFYARGTNIVVSITECPIAEAAINAQLPAIKKEALKFTKPYKVEVELLPGGEVRTLWNSKHSQMGFRQINNDQNAALQNWIAHLSGALNPAPQQLLDLFGGSGNFSLPIASKFKFVECVDISAPRTRPRGTPENMSYHTADSLVWLKKQPTPRTTSLAIIDPPRLGLEKNVAEFSQELTRMKTTSIIAIGCDTDSWARDMARWVRHGWKLEQIALVDFFPQTPHIESASLLTYSAR